MKLLEYVALFLDLSIKFAYQSFYKKISEKSKGPKLVLEIDEIVSFYKTKKL